MTASTTRRTTGLRSRTAAVGAIAVAGALLLTGCGDQTKKEGGSESASTSAAPLADKLPASIRDKGVINVGSDIAYAPVEYKDESGKVVGIDLDIAAAMGKQLGVDFKFQNATFDTLIGGLAAKRYDIAMSAMTDTKDRQEGIDADTGKKVGAGVDFVSRFFAPRLGVPEDPVTGSAHCLLTPFWSGRLGRRQLRARQLSRRGGELACELRGDRVRIAGGAVPYLQGRIELPSTAFASRPARA